MSLASHSTLKKPTKTGSCRLCIIRMQERRWESKPQLNLVRSGEQILCRYCGLPNSSSLLCWSSPNSVPGSRLRGRSRGKSWLLQTGIQFSPSCQLLDQIWASDEIGHWDLRKSGPEGWGEGGGEEFLAPIKTTMQRNILPSAAGCCCMWRWPLELWQPLWDHEVS